MSYLASEQSVHDSQPVELYKFVGTYANYCYTSGPEDVVYDDLSGDGPLTYVAINVERSELKTGTQEDDGLDLTVTMSCLQNVAVDYAFTVSPPDLELIIYRQQPDETIVYWKGPINNITVDEGGRAQFRNPSVLSNALTGNVPNVYYQTPCNNVLYGVPCGVDYALWSQATTVTGISADGKTISVGSIGTLDGKMVGGELALTNGERRMVISNTGLNVVVNFPFSRITVGEGCTVAAGCDQNYTGDCKNKFNNQARFTGFRFIPPINPFASGIEPAAAGVTDDACVFHPPMYWGTMSADTDNGPNVPVIGPWAWNFSLWRGGVMQVGMLSADNYSDYSGGGPPVGGVYEGLHGWTTFFFTPEAAVPRGEAGFATDPFIDGPPDTLHVEVIQWPYADYIFPGDSTFSGDHGTCFVTIDIPQWGFVRTVQIFDVIGLWPQGPGDYPL